MKFFVPDWDDLVDPDYDFATERFALVRAPHEHDLYAHEVFPDRVYDGILVSRMALGESGPKRIAVERIGMRAYLRLPPDLLLLGDCGAFGYIRDRVPRIETPEILDYYARLGFDLGVSIDHAIVTEFADQRAFRYDLTLRNADEFLRLHYAGGHHFIPVGAVQGWDVPSYVEAAGALVAMGYNYLAIGGLARSRTHLIEEIVSSLVAALPKRVRLHVFGVARPFLLARFLELGVASVDSASPIRQAWLSSTDNYYTATRTYAAIRIPIVAQERPKPDTLVGRSGAAFPDLVAAEAEALSAMRAYDRGDLGLRATLRSLTALDVLLANRLDGQRVERRAELYRQTLRDKPWQRCPCAICRALGVEVILFRGNNRNRRRGFHNLWLVYQGLDRHRLHIEPVQAAIGCEFPTDLAASITAPRMPDEPLAGG